ncbi:MAG: hypothetical protein IRZ33_03155 [Alicyclobacillaceae bacterium]|nr:hypothetical protein [Alicyclobacillaceae bacterium]
MYQYGYGSTPFTAGASNPQAIRQQIAQDLHGPGSWQQAGAAAPGASTLAQFGTNPQWVQQQIQQDLAQASHAFPPTGAFYGANPAVMAAGASNPQMVRQQIQQDLGQQAPGQNPAGGFGTSTLAQFGSQPQEIRQQIAQDLGQNPWQGQPQYLNPYAQAGVYQPVQNQAYYNPAVFQQVMHSVQTNPQQVRQQIQQDIQSGMQPPAFLQQAPVPAGAMQAPSGSLQPGSTLGQFGTNPQLMRQQIQSDLGQPRYFS